MLLLLLILLLLMTMVVRLNDKQRLTWALFSCRWLEMLKGWAIHLPEGHKTRLSESYRLKKTQHNSYYWTSSSIFSHAFENYFYKTLVINLYYRKAKSLLALETSDNLQHMFRNGHFDWTSRPEVTFTIVTVTFIWRHKEYKQIAQ